MVKRKVDAQLAGQYSREGMGGNPKGSFWSRMPRHMRHRKKVEVSLSDEARAILALIAEAEHGGNRSAAVEELLRQRFEHMTPSQELRAAAKASDLPAPLEEAIAKKLATKKAKKGGT